MGHYFSTWPPLLMKFFSFSLIAKKIRTILCATIRTYTTITTCSIFFSAFCKQPHLFVRSVLFTRKVSSHKADWITTHSSSALACPVIIQTVQRTFLLYWAFYCDFIFVCVLCTHNLLLRSLTLRLHSLSLSYSCSCCC